MLIVEIGGHEATSPPSAGPANATGCYPVARAGREGARASRHSRNRISLLSRLGGRLCRVRPTPALSRWRGIGLDEQTPDHGLALTHLPLDIRDRGRGIGCCRLLHRICSSLLDRRTTATSDDSALGASTAAYGAASSSSYVDGARMLIVNLDHAGDNGCVGRMSRRRRSRNISRTAPHDSLGDFSQ